MGRPAVKWGNVARYFSRRGFTIYSDGGDNIIQAPKNSDAARSRQQVRIGHRFSNHAGAELRDGHLGMIRRAFGVTREQILAG